MDVIFLLFKFHIINLKIDSIWLLCEKRKQATICTRHRSKDGAHAMSVLVQIRLHTNWVIDFHNLSGENLDSIYFALNRSTKVTRYGDSFQIGSPACRRWFGYTICHYLFDTTVLLQFQLNIGISIFHKNYRSFFFRSNLSLSLVSVSSNHWCAILPANIEQSVKYTNWSLLSYWIDYVKK